MTVASSWCHPDPVTLAGWCRTCCPLPLRQGWLGPLTIQRVEVLVELAPALSLPRFERQVLSAFAGPDPCAFAQLDAKLHLGKPLLPLVLQRLAAADLVTASEAGHALTALGEVARRHGECARRQRRVFTFVERPNQTPHFLSLPAFAGLPVATAAPFDLGQLESCLGQPVEWEAQHGFPTDVTALAPREGHRAVPLVQTEWLPVLLIETVAGLAGHVLESTGGPPAQPAFTLAAGWADVLPHLPRSFSTEQAQQAWTDWCRALRLEEVPTDSIRAEAGKLRVELPSELAHDVRARAEQAGWTLLGSGDLRALVQLDIAAAR